MGETLGVDAVHYIHRLDPMSNNRIIGPELGEEQFATLEPGATGWNLRHHNMPEITDLFGSEVLPTPFTLDMPAETVLARLRETMDVPVFYIPTPEDGLK